MILKQENNQIIRTIEYRDKNEILEMFKQEDFGLIGILANQKPYLSDEIRIIDSVLTKDILDTEYIILEQDGILVSYANVYHDEKNKIHIGSMITKKEYRNHGYGSILLQFIKEYSEQNNLIIKTESLTCRNLLLRMGFSMGKRNTDFIYNPKTVNQNINTYPIFLDYEGQQKIDQEKTKKEIESFTKSLEFFKDIGIL